MTLKEIENSLSKAYQTLMKNNYLDITRFVSKEMEIEENSNAIGDPAIKEEYLIEEYSKVLQDMELEIARLEL